MALTFELTDKGWQEARVSIGFESLARSWSHWYHDLPPESYPQLVTAFEAIDQIIGDEADHRPFMFCPFRGTLLLAHAEAVHETIRLLVEEYELQTGDCLAHPMDLPDLDLIYEGFVDPNVARIEKLLTSWLPPSEPIPLLPTIPTLAVHDPLLPPVVRPIQPTQRVPKEFYPDYTSRYPSDSKLRFNPLPYHVGPMYFVCLGLRSLIHFWPEYFHDLPSSSRGKAAQVYGEARLDRDLDRRVYRNPDDLAMQEIRGLLQLALAQALMDSGEIMDSFEEDENGDYPAEYDDMCDQEQYIRCLLHNLDPPAQPAE
jgi:hypothetical protein